MVRTQHQQLNHQQCHKLGARYMRSRIIFNALYEPKSKRFMELIMKAVKLHIFNPYREPKKPKNYAVRKV